MTKNILVSILYFVIITGTASAQKIITDGSILYNVSVVSGKDQPGIKEAFDGATMTVLLKGNQARTDLKSSLRVLTVFYNAKDKSAVVLKESGAEKYMLNLTAAQWEQYNKRYSGIQFDYQNDTKIVAGYNCKKATGLLRDGSKLVLYYTEDVKPYSSGYEYAFSQVPGLPLEYEITTGNIVLRYQAASVQLAPVNSSRFELPKAGYKVLDYRQ